MKQGKNLACEGVMLCYWPSQELSFDKALPAVNGIVKLLNSHVFSLPLRANRER